MNRFTRLRAPLSLGAILVVCVLAAVGCQDESGEGLITGPDAKSSAEGKKPRPPIPPANPEIVGVFNGSLYVVDADGSNLTLVLKPPRHSTGFSHPSWSPDRSAIVYSSPDWSIWAVNIDGTDSHQLQPAGYFTICPEWSPTGLEIAYADYTEPPSSVWNINVFPANGGAPVTVCTLPGLTFWGALVWNSDGTKLLFSQGDHVYVIDRDTGTATLVASGFATSPIYGLDWARQDVDTIAFSTLEYEIYTLDISVPGQIPVYVTGGTTPAFSPDDSKIAFWAGGLHTYTFATGVEEDLGCDLKYIEWLR